ncbi:16840_t:CDS:2, partial [Entrophospora sp. SA101]
MSTRRKRTSKAISDDESVEYISSSERQSSSRRKTKAKRSRSNTDREEIYDVERMSATAESGVIDSIELINFMCHKFLKVSFGPKINFVTGHNGSGKSAILTAIT